MLLSTGYIKLYRKIEDSIVWTNSDMLKLWLLCLTKAAHTERKFLFNGKELRLEAGQFVTGRKSLTDDFNKGVKPKDKANERTLWRYIKQLEKEEMLSINSNAQYSVISIVNWCSYQQSDQQLSNDCPTPVHQVSTNKNDKNDKNDKKSNKSNESDNKLLEENFNKLWKLYPNKKGRKDALKHYKRSIKNGVTNKQIQDGIVSYKKDLARNDWMKPAMGSTWFNKERWDDEMETEQEQKKNGLKDILEDMYGD